MTDVETKDSVWTKALTVSEASLVSKAIAKSSHETRREVAKNLRELIEVDEE
jgi:adenine-specific DNA methylase